ncbi:unnamed protein product [Brachionus calyciflorus]|uniref:Homeobox domain-containing protein n=1 Tax=Brachionus calyciflorus TaxID=104777 RepID=A0A814G0E4_9BILA|nr:unnamed protein product [Brachionus calyciflorus]
MMKQFSAKSAEDSYLLDDAYLSNEEESSNYDELDEDADLDTDYIDLNNDSLDNIEHKSSGTNKTNNASSKCSNRSRKRTTINQTDYSNFKKRKCRTTFNKYQLSILENEFLISNFVSNEKLDYLIQSTGLDSRIIKNWFKNKRSRVMADNKSNTTLIKPVPVALPTPPKSANDDGKIIKNVQSGSSLSTNINKNLNGLFNVVQSINTDDVKIKQTDTLKEHKKIEMENCTKCVRLGKDTCNCNISNVALRRLYKYYTGFNGPLIEFFNNYDEKYFFNYENANNDENGKVFFVL